MATEDLQRWIDALDRLPDDQPPSREAMVAVATDIGLDPDVLEQAEAEAHDLGVQGRRFSEEGLHDDAVRTLDAALALQPWSNELRADLGRALLARHQHRPTPADAERVERVARLLIRADPEADVGYALLKGLSVPSSAPPSARGVSWPVATAGMLGGAVVLAGLGVFVLDAVRGVPNPPDVSDESTPAVAVDVPNTRQIGDLDVAIHRVELPDALKLEVTNVDLVPTSGGAGWIASVGVVATNTEAPEPLVLSELVLSIEAVDAEGRHLAASDMALVEDSAPAIYPGDRVGADAYVRSTRATGTPTLLHVRIERVKTSPGSREPGPEVELEWPDGVPASVGVRLRAREAGTCGGSLIRFCKGVYVVENTGTVPLDTLRVRAHFGTSGASDWTYAISGDGRALDPGERTPFRVIEQVGDTVDAATLTPWRFEVEEVRTL